MYVMYVHIFSFAAASIIDNWMREIETWRPSTKAYKYHGSQQAFLREYATC